MTLLAALRPLLPYLKAHRPTLAVGVVCLAATNAAALLGPWVLKLAIDDLSSGVDRAVLLDYLALIVLVAAVVGVLRYLMRRTLIGLSRKIEYDLRNDLFAHLTTLDAAYYKRTSTGDLMNRLVNDLSAVRMVLGPALMNVGNTAVVLAAVVVLLARIDARLTLVALGPIALLTVTEKVLGSRLHRRYTIAQEELSRLSNLCQENLAGIRVVKAYAQEPSEERRFTEQSRRLLARNLDTARISAVFHPLMSLLAGSSLVLVLYLGGNAVIRGELSLGTFVAFQAYVALLVWPMIALGWVLNLFERGAASMTRLQEILSARPQVADPALPTALARAAGALEARDVRFRYPGAERDALGGISFRVAAGGSLGIVGETGSGKTTLVSLLVRRFDPTHGEIRLDGVDLRQLLLSDLRRAVGFVPQEPVLFSDTIRANIAFAPEGAGDEEVAAAARLAQLESDVLGFPDRFETRVGERGVTLSGGQKQRVALARALLHAPAVVVLDDALSAVDAETEAGILERFDRATAGRTRVIVSHRVSAVRAADEVLVLHEGEIVERGSHDQLVALGGRYAELNRRQRLEAEIEAA